ncbi:hypothetical protein Lal_00047917 [Lupinus albus]|nr:hypothetical protein Lal_00047917 [Lupinus albus]
MDLTSLKIKKEMSGPRIAHATLKGPSVVKELLIGLTLGLAAGGLWKMHHWNEQRKIRHSSAPQYVSRGSMLFLFLAWLAAALSSSTSSHAATHSPLMGSPEHASSAFFMLSSTFFDMISGCCTHGSKCCNKDKNEIEDRRVQKIGIYI